MADQQQSVARVAWKAPLLVAFAGFAAVVAYAISDEYLGNMVALIMIVPLVTLALLVLAFRNRWRGTVVILIIAVVFVSSSVAAIRRSMEVRSTVRWMFRSKIYKTEVLRQAQPSDGSLQHVVWGETGFGGVGNNEVYLVYDPEDSLAVQMKHHDSGDFRGIPCGVAAIHRLARSWYSVQTYTDTTWDFCEPIR